MNLKVYSHKTIATAIYYSFAIAILFSTGGIGIAIDKMGTQPTLEPNSNRYRAINRRCEWTFRTSENPFFIGPAALELSPVCEEKSWIHYSKL